MADGQILVLTAGQETEPVPPGGKGWGRAPETPPAATMSAVSTTELGRRLSDLLSQISTAVGEAETAAAGFGVAEIQVSVTVTADGKLALLGVGLGASTAATFQLTLRRG